MTLHPPKSPNFPRSCETPPTTSILLLQSLKNKKVRNLNQFSKFGSTPNFIHRTKSHNTRLLGSSRKTKLTNYQNDDLHLTSKQIDQITKNVKIETKQYEIKRGLSIEQITKSTIEESKMDSQICPTCNINKFEIFKLLNGELKKPATPEAKIIRNLKLETKRLTNLCADYTKQLKNLKTKYEKEMVEYKIGLEKDYFEHCQKVVVQQETIRLEKQKLFEQANADKTDHMNKENKRLEKENLLLKDQLVKVQIDLKREFERDLKNEINKKIHELNLIRIEDLANQKTELTNDFKNQKDVLKSTFDQQINILQANYQEKMKKPLKTTISTQTEKLNAKPKSNTPKIAKRSKFKLEKACPEEVKKLIKEKDPLERSLELKIFQMTRLVDENSYLRSRLGELSKENCDLKFQQMQVERVK